MQNRNGCKFHEPPWVTPPLDQPIPPSPLWPTTAISIGASIYLYRSLTWCECNGYTIGQFELQAKIFKRSTGVIKNKFYAQALTAVGFTRHKRDSKNDATNCGCSNFK